MDPQYNEVDSNSLESVGKRKKMAKKIKASSVTYPQKRVVIPGKAGSDPTTSPKRVTQNSGAKNYTKVKTTIKK